jgi:hypothetical protein
MIQPKTAAELLKMAEVRKVPKRELERPARLIAESLLTTGELIKTKTNNFVYYELPRKP